MDRKRERASPQKSKASGSDRKRGGGLRRKRKKCEFYQNPVYSHLLDTAFIPMASRVVFWRWSQAGVMAAASRGAARVEGPLVVGVLPEEGHGDDRQRTTKRLATERAAEPGMPHILNVEGIGVCRGL